MGDGAGVEAAAFLDADAIAADAADTVRLVLFLLVGLFLRFDDYYYFYYYHDEDEYCDVYYYCYHYHYYCYKLK